MVAVPAPGSRASTRGFYVGMSLACAVIAVVGFSQRYFAPLAAGTFEAPAIVHVHAVITFGWVAFLMLQAALVATGRTALHRSLGLAGIALGTLLVFTAAQAAIINAAAELADGDVPFPREFLAAPMSLAVLITGLFGCAIAYVHRPEVHKRLMMTATFVILTPAFARILQLLGIGADRISRGDLAILVSGGMIMVAIAHDVRTRGKPHPAYLAGLVCVVFTRIARDFLRSTPAWHGAADWLVSLAN